MAYAVEINADNFAPAKIGSISTIINVLIPLILIVASLLLLVGLIRAAFTYITASGDSKHIDEAKQQMQWTIVGFVFIMISYLITKVICYIMKVPCPL